MVAALALVAAWLLIEFVLPAVFFLAYLGVRGALARVANDDHDCQGLLTRSMGWGTLWSSIYVLPLALMVWGMHWLATQR